MIAQLLLDLDLRTIELANRFTSNKRIRILCPQVPFFQSLSAL